MTSNKSDTARANADIAFSAIRDLFAERINRTECIRRLGVYLTAVEVAAVMVAADRNVNTVQHMAWRPLCVGDIAYAISTAR